MNVPHFVRELKRRKVFRVAVVYAATSFVILQAADLILPALLLPEWTYRMLVLLVLFGFPIALVLSWAFDITPDGVVRTEAEVQDDERRREPHVVVSRATLRTQRIAAAAGVLILALGGGAFIVLGGRNADAEAEVERSVAVLPFANLSGDPENEYFSDGITDDILIQLAKIADLKVISRSSVMAYKGTSGLRLREIGEELDVAHILEGSVRRDGNRVRIAAQLVDVRTDRHLWAETYDRELTGIFEIQSEIAQQIARALQARLSPAEQARVATAAATNLTAYELYLKAREERVVRGGEEGRAAALTLLSEALRLDPHFAPAYAAWVHTFVPLTRRPTQAELDSAAQLARRAIEVAPERADGWAALGLVMRRSGRIDEAEAAYRRAFALGPNDVAALGGMGWVHTMRNEHDEALRWRRRAAELDPGEGTRHRQLGATYEALGEYDRAERSFERAVSLLPDIWFFHGDLIRQHLRRGEIAAALARLQRAQRAAEFETDTRESAASIELARGDTATAIRYFEEANAAATRVLPVLSLGVLYWRLGERDKAERIFTAFEGAAREMLADHDHASILYDLALIRALRGDTDAAVAELERARQARLSPLVFETRPLPDDVQRDPRVTRILDAVVAEQQRQRERARREGWL